MIALRLHRVTFALILVALAACSESASSPDRAALGKYADTIASVVRVDSHAAEIADQAARGDAVGAYTLAKRAKADLDLVDERLRTTTPSGFQKTQWAAREYLASVQLRLDALAAVVNDPSPKAAYEARAQGATTTQLARATMAAFASDLAATDLFAADAAEYQRRASASAN